MGFFKSREEKEAERRQRELEAEQLALKISSSPMTQMLQEFLKKAFGDIGSEEVELLRRMAAGGGRAGCVMEVQCKGILFTFADRKGVSLHKEMISFDAMGYQDLSSAGVDALKKILLQTLRSFPHLMVLDTGFFMYEKNRTKQSW